ncbi:MAG: hypothetical protein ACRC7O_05895 [Fimbriiglobus sp.]
MVRGLLTRAAVVAGAVTLFVAVSQQSSAGDPPLPIHSYYPYQYFPHSYWPAQSPRYPEAPGQPYQRPPAYMAYPAFKEPGWRYELWTPMKWHKGNHFWLDQF